MNNADRHWVTLSLLIALLAIMINLSAWQIGIIAVILIISLVRGDQPSERKQSGKRRNRRERK